MIKKTLFIVLILVIVSAHTFKEGSNVIQDPISKKTTSKWRDELKQLENSFVFLYQTWCGHCKTSIPQIDQAADMAKADKQNKLKFVAINCGENKEFCKFMNVTGYPTFYFVYDLNNIQAYESERSATAILEYTKKHKASQGQTYEMFAKDYIEEKEVPEFGSENSKVKKVTMDTIVSLVNTQFTLFYAPWCPHCKSLLPVISQLAEEMDGQMQFSAVDCTVQDDLCSRFKVDGYPTLMFFFNNGQVVSYEKGRSMSNIRQFVTSGYKEVSQVNKVSDYIENFDTLTRSDKDLYFEYEKHRVRFFNFIDKQENRAVRIAGMIGIVIISVFLCLLKDCATRSTRKPKNE